jgi:hypothetical protein
MATGTNETLVEARIRRWREVRSGSLVVTPGQIVVYRRKFTGRLEKVEDFETGHLSAVEYDRPGSAIRLVFNGSQGDPREESFSCATEKSAEALNTILVRVLREAEEKKKAEEEEAIRLEAERQERLKQIREAFAREVWDVSEVVWLIAKADYDMVKAVITADGKEAREQYSTLWQQSDRLKQTCQVDLLIPLKELDEVIAAQNGEEVIRKASHLLGELYVQLLQADLVWHRWQEHKKMLTDVTPNYSHVPYFLLFGASYFEAMLSAGIDDWAGVNNILSLLTLSGIVLKSCYGIDPNGSFDGASTAVAQRDMHLLAESTRRIESTIIASFKARSFRYEMSAQH